MEQEKINRINELAAKVKSGAELTREEFLERERLRMEYRRSICGNLTNTLKSCTIVDENGTVLRNAETEAE